MRSRNQFGDEEAYLLNIFGDVDMRFEDEMRFIQPPLYEPVPCVDRIWRGGLVLFIGELPNGKNFATVKRSNNGELVTEFFDYPRYESGAVNLETI